MLTETFLLYGQPKPPTELIPLCAGPLTMLYDPASGMLRRIKLGEREVLRGIYAAVRDRNWGTVPSRIRETKRTIQPESFRLEFESEHHRDEIHFVWRGVICGEADGTLLFDFDGEARTTFLRNRIGFCVLHPISECAGARAEQRRMDGTEIECGFPELIEPQIIGRGSFRDLRGVAHEIADGLWAEMEFEGDTFEMEDQRNWTDASFKTYCTPLALPFPAEIARSTRVRQSVTMRLRSRQREEADSSGTHVNPPPHVGGYESSVTLNIPSAPTSTLPRIGLGVASHGDPLSETEAATLRQLRPVHLRVDVRLAANDWATSLERAAREAIQLDAKVELALHLPCEGEVDSAAVTRVLKRHVAMFERVLALREGEPATSAATLMRVRKLLGAIPVPIGCGSDWNFCELNREHARGRLGLADADFIFWSMNPQVHASDHLSIMETLEAQAATVRSARAFAGKLPIVISPVTLKQRFNPVATAAPETTAPGELPPQVDPRQLSHFAAAWTVGSVAALASAGVESITFFETTGWRGVMERAAGSPMPAQFPSRPGVVFPVLQAWEKWAGFSHAAIVPTASPASLSAQALFAEKRLKRILIANLADAIQVIALDVAGHTIQLRPYEVARIDL